MKNKLYLIVCALCMFSLNAISQIDISEARSMAIGQEVTIEGIVTNGSELGIIRYVQDGTGGIAVYPGSGSVGNFPDEVKRGDRIRVTGELKEFNNLLEIDPIQDYTIISTGNTLPEPLLSGADDINEENEAVLLKISNVEFDDGGSTFGVGNYSFTADGQSSEIYIRSNHPLLGSEIPLAKVDLTGIVSQFHSTYQLLPRDMDDLVVVDNFFLTSSPTQSDIRQDGFTVSWTTSAGSNSIIRYGTSMSLDNEMVVPGNTTEHEVTLDGLDAGEFYYVQIASSNGSSEASSQIQYYATASESSGEIRVYFNHPVDANYSDGSEPESKSGLDMENAIIDYIENAEESIDISMYNTNRFRIVNALSEAHNRGVVVRMVADNGTANTALSNPSPDFTVIKGNSDGLMHNKFLVIDEGSVNDSWVLMGSMNFTENNIGTDYNNMIAIQDQSLARAYTIEFEEMWGSDGDAPGIFNVKFGADKEDNTPHLFNVNGMTVESYFSPSDNTTSAIAKSIDQADSELYFAILTFTNNTLGTSVLDAHNSGVEVRGIIDNITDTGTEYDYLLSNGVAVSPDNTSLQTHHKYCVIDAKSPNMDPVVITGSHNWSGSAETRNDENTLIFHDSSIANIFLQEFEARWCESQGGSPCVTSVEEIINSEVDFVLSPNPVNSILNFELDLGNKADVSVELYSMDGRLSYAQLLRDQNALMSSSIDVSMLDKGTYVLLLRFDDKVVTEKFIKL